MPAPSKFVPCHVIQKIFNDGNYVEKTKTGELTTEVQRSNHPSPPLSFEPFCTESQMVRYVNKRGKTVALVHQYLRPDGKIGASGKPDPKFLFHRGIVYKSRP